MDFRDNNFDWEKNRNIGQNEKLLISWTRTKNMKFQNRHQIKKNCSFMALWQYLPQFTTVFGSILVKWHHSQ